jgi:two-component system nitrate/nitrite response regulator NarL
MEYRTADERQGAAVRPDLAARVLLISSDHFGWAGLRATLHARCDVRVVGEVFRPDRMAIASHAENADIVLMAAELVNPAIIDALDLVHRHRPTCKFVFMGELPKPSDLVALARAGVAGCVHWQDSSDESVQQILALIRACDVVVLSRVAIVRMFEEVGARATRQGGHLTLSDQERAVLSRLAAGMSREDLAHLEHMSVRTVKRVIAGLQSKFEAPTTFVLAMLAARLGYLT